MLATLIAHFATVVVGWAKDFRKFSDHFPRPIKGIRVYQEFLLLGKDAKDSLIESPSIHWYVTILFFIHT
jgi:hypothetical protein